MAEQQLGLKVGVGATNRTCPACGQNDPGKAAHEVGDDPRHIVLGAAVQAQQATLQDGTVVAVNVPVDVAYHMDCHADLGCDHCADTLEHNGGSVKGKVGKVKAPPHLDGHDITEHFSLAGGNGIARRTQEGDKHMKAVYKNG